MFQALHHNFAQLIARFEIQLSLEWCFVDGLDKLSLLEKEVIFATFFMFVEDL